jgi:hypothetical protein
MLRKIVKAMPGTGGRQRDVVLPSAVPRLLKCTFGFDPDVVIARDDQLHSPGSPECLKGELPIEERVGYVPGQDESIW